jgi:hypothetical protein
VKRDEGVSHNVTVAKNVKSYYPNWMISVIAVAIYCTLETSLLLGCVVVVAWLEVKKKSCFSLAERLNGFFLPLKVGSLNNLMRS